MLTTKNHITLTAGSAEWKPQERFIFRIVFIYFMLQALPLDWKYYRHTWNIHWASFQYKDLFYVARYTPQFLAEYNPLSWGMNTLTDWAIILLAALTGSILWGLLSKRKEYNDAYYVLRLVIRYRLAVGVIAYGFIKLFPMQLPYPSLSLENTNYGDFSDWKTAYLSYGVAPSFEAFIGGVEVLAGLLLLNRKSASIGAAIVVGVVGNVFLSNLAYNGGDTIYCLYLLLMATTLIFYDVLRWHSVIMVGRITFPNNYQPLFYQRWKKNLRPLLKTSFTILLLLLYGSYSYALYRDGGYQYPNNNGLANSAGLYNVKKFRINNSEHPYSLTDSVRWQNVVFEKWATISILSKNAVRPEMSNTEEIFVTNEDRSFESSGSAGRHFYQYKIDSVQRLLFLQNKNKYHASERLTLRYKRINDRDIILSGLNEKGDSIYAELEKIPKIYLLDESNKIPVKRSVFYKP